MIEIIAKALYEEDRGICREFGFSDIAWENSDDQASYRKTASAVLQALADAGYMVIKPSCSLTDCYWGPNPSKKDTT